MIEEELESMGDEKKKEEFLRGVPDRWLCVEYIYDTYPETRELIVREMVHRNINTTILVKRVGAAITAFIAESRELTGDMK